MELMEKLKILTGAAKYDVACTSSGSSRPGVRGMVGSAVAGGICHSFAADGRCISLLKVLMSNVCVYDCKYCANRRSNDVPRATFTAEELAGLTIGFYKRNYIEGLFLSSGVVGSPDATTERMARVLGLLRQAYGFNGYIHVKAIPGAAPELITKLGMLADRVSVNIELPSEAGLARLAPDKSKEAILRPMAQIRDSSIQSSNELALYRHAPRFAPAGQGTQMIIGATPDTDYQIMRLAEGLYGKYRLRRVFYSAYVPVGSHDLLPAGQPPPLLREHRLYQTDWLLRFYGFKASELLSEGDPYLDLRLDPKCHWAMRNLHLFPVEVNKAERETLLRVPGIGAKSADRIVLARRSRALDFDNLRRLGVTLKRAVYFITCSGKYMHGLRFSERGIYGGLLGGARLGALRRPGAPELRQATFFPEAANMAAIGEKPATEAFSIYSGGDAGIGTGGGKDGDAHPSVWALLQEAAMQTATGQL